MQVERLAQGVEPTESEDHASQFADAAAGRLGDATLLTQGGQYVVTHRARKEVDHNQPQRPPQSGFHLATGVSMTSIPGAMGSVTTVLKASSDMSMPGQAANVVAPAGMHVMRTVQNTNVPGVLPQRHALVKSHATWRLHT